MEEFRFNSIESQIDTEMKVDRSAEERAVDETEKKCKDLKENIENLRIPFCPRPPREPNESVKTRSKYAHTRKKHIIALDPVTQKRMLYAFSKNKSNSKPVQAEESQLRIKFDPEYRTKIKEKQIRDSRPSQRDLVH